jgi:hypothetical protein
MNRPAAAARFRVRGLLSLGVRSFVCGDIVEGTIEPGMNLFWPVHGEDITIDLVVRSVDPVEYPGGVPCVALGVTFAPDEQVDSERMLRELCEDGMIVSVGGG